MFLDISRDALGEELTTDDIAKQEQELDLELLKLIQKACSTTNERPTRQARALELTRMIHHTVMIDKAIQVARFYKLRGLEDRMNRIKMEREDEDRLRAARDRRRDWASDLNAVPAPRQPRDAQAEARSKAFSEFNPPAPVHRPGLARATPSTAEPFWAAPPPKASTSRNGASPYGGEEEPATVASPFGESKRKRLVDDAPEPTSDADAKRRALDQGPLATRASKCNES